jgi:hypothetical protein
MPSDFILAAATVAALSPKSHGRLTFAWLTPPDDFAAEMLDTAGRVVYFMALVMVCALFEKFIG